MDWRYRPFLVIVYEYIPEYNRFDFASFHPVRGDPVQKLFFQGGKEAFYPGIVETMVDAGQALEHPSLLQLFPERLAGIFSSTDLPPFYVPRGSLV